MQNKFLVYLTSTLLTFALVGCGSNVPATVDVEGVSLDKLSEILMVGDTLQLHADVYPNNATNKDVTWSATGEDIVSVENGLVTALKAGESTVTVTTVDGGYTASCSLIVRNEGPISDGNLLETKLQTFNLSKEHTLKEEEIEVISKYDIGERSYYHLENEPYDYYLTLEDYFDILKTNAKDGYIFSISNDRYVYTVEVINPNSESIDYTTIDIENRLIHQQGSIYSAFNTAPNPDYSTYSLFLDVRYDDTNSIPYKDRVNKYSFKYVDFHFYRKDNKIYFPLSLLTAHFVKDIDLNYIFDGKNMYFYDSNNQITSIFFADKPIEGNIDDNIMDWMKETFANDKGQYLMPTEMARSYRDSFYYAMDNYYGIRTTRQMESYALFYESCGWSDKFLSPYGEERGYAYATAINLLDDQHTALGMGSSGISLWEERLGYVNAPASKLKTERFALNSMLTENRLKAFGLEDSKALRNYEKYSSDGKTAYVYLNEFAYTTDAATVKDGKIVSRKSEEELKDSDSYYYLLNRIKKIEAKGGVENIVIDMSTNGGGTIGILDKIATLFSKTNGFETYTRNDNTGNISTTKTFIDSNYDGVYDDTDVYGNKFKFYLMTSPCSFSCGNALPFYCQLAGTVKVIGQRSGGGECSVTSSQMGSLRTFTHSSNTHIMSYITEKVDGQDVKKMVFAEDGAEPNSMYNFGYEYFYDFEYIADLIKQNNK